MMDNENSDDIFSHVLVAPTDPILGASEAYKNDQDPNKMDLGVGAYRTDQEKPYVFEVIKEIEKGILDDLMSGKINKEYLPIEGHAGFCEVSKKLIFGQNCPNLDSIVTVQSISGTGSLRIGALFLKNFMTQTVYVSNPTWGNHISICDDSGLKTLEYPYYNPKDKSLDFEGMINFLKKLNEGSIILLHVGAHNPTGVDPTEENWREIAEVMKSRKLFPFFDTAYQGFASGSFEADAYPVRLFNERGFQMLVAQSYSKNMGLYGDRIGALHVVCSTPHTAEKVLSQMKLVIRPMYSSPPMHGALLVYRVLSSPDNFKRWNQELSSLSSRIIEVRKILKEKLLELKTPGNWDHIVNQIGMFSFTGLNEKICETLNNKYHVYLVRNGRMSFTGVTSKNVSYLAESIKKAIEENQNQ